MKKILIILALLGFVSCIDAQKKSIKPAAQPMPALEGEAVTDLLRDQVNQLHSKIKDAEHQVRELHRQIAEWTKQAAPLEADLSHKLHSARAGRKGEHAHHEEHRK